jgi:glycerophosphoryl diester phosphodiesterase
LPEVKKLRAKQAFAKKSATVQQSICNRHFEEVIALAKLKSKELGRTIEFIPKQTHS